MGFFPVWDHDVTMTIPLNSGFTSGEERSEECTLPTLFRTVHATSPHGDLRDESVPQPPRDCQSTYATCIELATAISGGHPIGSAISSSLVVQEGDEKITEDKLGWLNDQ